MKNRALAALVAVALAGCTVGPDYVRPAVDAPAAWRIDYPKAADVANTKWWEQFGDPVLERPDRDGVARESRRAHRRRARRPVHRRPRLDALAVVSPDRLRRGRHPRPRQPGRPAAASRRRRPLFHAVPGIARRVLATRPVRPGPPPERGGAGAGLRERAGAAGGRAVGGQRRRIELHRAARARPAARDRRRRRRRTSARRRASSTCASRPASCRRRKSCRSARSTSRRSPRFRPSSSRSPRRRT